MPKSSQLADPQIAAMPDPFRPPHHLHWPQLPPTCPGSKRKPRDQHESCPQNVQILNPTQLKVPLYPVVFTKPPDALAGPLDRVPVHPSAQGMLGYEGGLTVIISKDGKDIPEEEALSYVLGYTAGNDVSARNFQLPDESGGQYCYAKSFDAFRAYWALYREPESDSGSPSFEVYY